MEWLDTAVQFANVVGFAGGAFTLIFLRPLNANFGSLRVSIDRLSNKLDKVEQQQVELLVRIAEIEQRARSAHHRIDGWKGVWLMNDMKNWHTDTIIVFGLVAGLLILIIAIAIISVSNDDLKIIDLGKEMIAGLLGFIGGGVAQALKHKNEKE